MMSLGWYIVASTTVRSQMGIGVLLQEQWVFIVLLVLRASCRCIARWPAGVNSCIRVANLATVLYTDQWNGGSEKVCWEY